jgi:hypothetical protein
MAKRFLMVFGLVMLYMVVLAAILLPIVLLVQSSATCIVVVVLGTFVASIGGFVPYLDWVAKRVFRFPGEGEPVSGAALSGAALRAQIREVNEFDAPVMVRERKGRLVATWKYVDARWWELLARAGLTKVYELHIKLDDTQHLATLIDVNKSVSWRGGPTEVRVWGGLFRGIIWAYEIGKLWGIRENWQLGKVYDYKFVPQEIKIPIMNSILRNGWDVRFGIW